MKGQNINIVHFRLPHSCNCQLAFAYHLAILFCSMFCHCILFFKFYIIWLILSILGIGDRSESVRSSLEIFLSFSICFLLVVFA